MTKIIIGCDPDSDKSGIAIYANGELKDICSMTLIQIYRLFAQRAIDRIADANNTCELHIENLNGNNSSAFGHTAKQSMQVKNKISEGVGKCKQVQTEIERIAEYFEIKIVRHQVNSMWKSQIQKNIFESVTGWKGSSNEDSRSAAYFGYLGVITGKTTKGKLIVQ